MGFYKEKGYRLNAKFASGDEYATPWPTFWFWNQWMIDNGHRSFNLDPCSTKQNHKTSDFLTRRDNGLLASWEDRRAWINMPFAGGGVPRWTEKIVDACQKGATVGALYPGWGFGDPWCAENVNQFASEMTHLEGRIRFLGAPGKPSFKATFSSAFVLFLPGLRPAGTEIKTSWVKCPLSADDPWPSSGP